MDGYLRVLMGKRGAPDSDGGSSQSQAKLEALHKLLPTETARCVSNPIWSPTGLAIAAFLVIR